MKTLIKNIYQNRNFSKVFFLLEFIFTSLLVFSLFKYGATSDKIYYYLVFVSGFFLAFSLIFLVFKYRKKLEYLFLIIIIPLGLLYLVLLLPNYVPDEGSHITKAYTVSEFDLFPSKNKDDEPIMKVPIQLEANGMGEINSYQDIDYIMGRNTNYNKEINTTSVSAVSYFPIMYLIPSIGLNIGKLLNLNIYTGIYLAQALNLIFFAVTGFYVLKKIPFGKLLMFAYLLTPMMLQQATSCSADNFINCTVLLFVTYILSIRFDDKVKEVSLKQSIILGILMIFISCSKIVYLPLCFLVFLLYKKLKKSPKKVKAIVIGSLLLSLICAVGFYLYSMNYAVRVDYFKENNIDSALQLKNVITNPFTYIITLFNTLVKQQQLYITSFVGENLGWFNITGSYFSTILFVILLVIAPFLEKSKAFFKRHEKIIINLLVLLIFNFILGAMYLSWTSVGANVIEGVQGRYFIPIAFLTLLTLVMHNKHIEFKNTNITYFILILLVNINSLYTVYSFFR